MVGVHFMVMIDILALAKDFAHNLRGATMTTGKLSWASIKEARERGGVLQNTLEVEVAKRSSFTSGTLQRT